MVMIIAAESLSVFEQICKRNRCPMYVVGEVTCDGKLVLTDKVAPNDAVRVSWHAVQVENFSSILCEVPDHRQIDTHLLRRTLA